jgi:hypothetical protein
MATRARRPPPRPFWAASRKFGGKRKKRKKFKKIKEKKKKKKNPEGRLMNLA